jgi:hypothetical protein
VSKTISAMTILLSCFGCLLRRLILETDPATIANQVAMRGSEDSMSLTEQVKLCDMCFCSHLRKSG